MSWKRLQDIFARRVEDVFKTSWRRLSKTAWRCLEDLFPRRLGKTFWRRFGKTSWQRLEDVLKMYDQDEYIGLGQDLFKTSWRILLKMYESGEYVRLDQDVLKTFLRRLLNTKTKGVSKRSSSRRMFAGLLAKLEIKNAYYSIPLEKPQQKLLKLQRKFYKFIALPNGYTQSSKKFAKVLKSPLATLKI